MFVSMADHDAPSVADNFSQPTGTENAVSKHSVVMSFLQNMVSIVPLSLRLFYVRHRWKLTISTVVLALLTFGYIKITQDPEPEYITARVTRGNLVQTVEAVGTVISERNLKLQFPVSGVVGDVRVKEGDHVKQGDRLASLRAADLQAYVNSAYANVQATQADLQKLTEGTRSEDIVVAEAEVANKKAALAAAREQLVASQSDLALLEREAEINLSGEVGTARSTLSQQMTKSRNALAVFDDVMSDNDVSDAMTRADPALTSLIQDQRNVADVAGDIVLREGIAFDTHEDALRMLKLTRSAILSASNAVESLFSAIVTVPPTGSFTRSEREARKVDLNAEKNNLQTSLTSIDTAIKNLRDASATYETKIGSKRTVMTGLQGDILTYETSLRTQEAQLALKKAGSRQTDIDASAARVRQAQADLDRVRADFADTILSAPTAGFITKVNIKTGELLSTAFQQDAAITMLGESPYRIEMYASEVDIPKVAVGMEATVELDAFPGKLFALTVAEVDPAATSIDGVPKYRIKLDFPEPPERLKIGMTGDTDIFTGTREGVLGIPARAVIKNAEQREVVRVLLSDARIEERAVVTGLEGENDVEIISGLTEGETVVVLIKK
jgi:HlyD family secretion protein